MSRISVEEMRFDQEAIREIRARIDIGSFIGEYVPLRKRGNDFVGLCPFHDEKTPSFHVHPDRGFFKCFGCGAAGDVISFLQRREGIPFPDAARMLAQRAGVTLEPETPQGALRRTERETIYEANRLAAAFFSRMLASNAGAAARDYLQRRGISKETIERFGLGFAPPVWDSVVKELQRNDIDLAIASKAGLVKPGQRGYYDFYRDRLMIPTRAATGEVIAFGGRALGDAEPKYINTSTTPVYTKGRHLFALDVARRAAQREGVFIVVEGYFDCIALHQAGFENAVASLGTSFTQEQAHEMKKYAERAFLCFDGDAAGGTAATKAAEIASRVMAHAGASVRVVLLPLGADPDSFVREHGSESFRKLLARSKPAIEFRLDPEIDRLSDGFSSPAAVARRAETLIREMTPREEWDRWRVYIAGRLKVNPDDLRNSRFLANGANFSPRSDVMGRRHARVAGGVEPLSFEREVLSIVLEEPALAGEFAEAIPPTSFRNEAYRRIYARIVDEAQRIATTADVLGLFAADQASLDFLATAGSRDRSSTVRYRDTEERRAHLERIAKSIEHGEAERRYRELRRRIDEAFTAGEPIPEELRIESETLLSKIQMK
jgi:DNA primase catalytic core